MYDKTLVKQILNQIYGATEKIQRRFKPVKRVEYFTNSQEGMEKLDSICMQLIAIGEALKNIDKITDGELLKAYPEINWTGAKAMRDIISHHYFDIDAEVVFNVCNKKIDDLQKAVSRMLSDI